MGFQWAPDGQCGLCATYTADAVPKEFEAGRVRVPTGFLHVANRAGAVGAPQIPAMFDFSRTDGFVLQEEGLEARP
jgi:hypothetical protein